MLDAVTFPCAKSYYGGSLIVHDPQDTFRFELSTAKRDWLKSYIEISLADPGDPYQRYMMDYVGIVGHGPERWPRALNRFALSFDLIEHFLPEGGLWVDCGSMGFETFAMRQRIPNLYSRQFCWDGGVIVQDHEGMHYSGGTITPDKVWTEPCDIERNALPLETDEVSVLTCLETIEHFKFGPQVFMSEANRVLEPGGILIITTPNAASTLAMERIILGEHPAECAFYHKAFEHGRIHPAEYERQQMYALGSAFGFDFITLCTFDGAAPSPRQEALMRYMVEMRKREGLDAPPDFGEKWLLVARKARLLTEIPYPPQIFR